MPGVDQVVALTRELIQIDTRNPPGNELVCAKVLARRLEASGFTINLDEFEPGRANLVARRGGRGLAPPIVFSGHLDVVPLGDAAWIHSPFGGEVVGDRLYGRGATDMKGGVAAMIVAAERILRSGEPPGDVILALTASEETGCQGAKRLCEFAGPWGSVGGLVIAEPTDNMLVLGHKGALWLSVTLRGKAAHGAFPDRGINAIVMAADAIERISRLRWVGELNHSELGQTTLNVGTITGGSYINSVPDAARFTIDMRTVSPHADEVILDILRREVGDAAEIETLLQVPALPCTARGAWVSSIAAISEQEMGHTTFAPPVSYFTDGGVLAPALGMPPTVIVGPGSPHVAHTTDEFVSIASLETATSLYERIIVSGFKGD